MMRSEFSVRGGDKRWELFSPPPKLLDEAQCQCARPTLSDSRARLPRRSPVCHPTRGRRALNTHSLSLGWAAPRQQRDSLRRPSSLATAASAERARGRARRQVQGKDGYGMASRWRTPSPSHPLVPPCHIRQNATLLRLIENAPPRLAIGPPIQSLCNYSPVVRRRGALAEAKRTSRVPTQPDAGRRLGLGLGGQRGPVAAPPRTLVSATTSPTMSSKACAPPPPSVSRPRLLPQP